MATTRRLPPRKVPALRKQLVRLAVDSWSLSLSHLLGNCKRKRARNDADDEDEPMLSFIASAAARTKAHSKRAQVLLRKALAINRVTRPYVLLYIARYVSA